MGPTQEMLDLANAEQDALASLCTPLFACSQGSAINEGAGEFVWVDPGNADVCDQVATRSVPTSGQLSEWLYMSGFGFAVPLTAIVRGIMVSVVRRASDGAGAPLVSPRQIEDSRIQLTMTGFQSPVGQNKALLGVAWPSQYTKQDYGFTQDLWGVPWTPAEINAATFGIFIQAAAVGGGVDFVGEVVCINLCVLYDVPGVG